MERLLAIADRAVEDAGRIGVQRLLAIGEGARPSNSSRSDSALRGLRARRRLQDHEANKPAMDKALNLQILHHNKHIAKKPDDEIPVPGEKRSKISGSGRWQQMLPTTFLRVAFSHPASCETALDKEFKLGNGVSAKARAAGALML